MNDKLKLGSVSAGGAVECLGQSFANDQARRKHFLKLLAEKLKDPAFRKQEGFPKGTDEAILAMSDPPYYTACPNPWLAEFVTHYGRPYDHAEKYAREPMAIDVSVGKTDPIYKAHSYHTKVPHLAIVPSILHFTEPGDIVLDGFAGSGMTGVAAQWCGTAPAVYRHKLESEWRTAGMSAPKWGARRVVLNDLSPAATSIAASYNVPFNVNAFLSAGQELLLAVNSEVGWMYETLHSDGKTKGKIEFTVWSEVFSCPECAGMVNFINEAFDEENRVREVFPCPHCGAELKKDKLERVMVARVDPATKSQIQSIKYEPSFLIYSVGKKKFKKKLDDHDLAVVKKIEEMPFPNCAPNIRFPIEYMYHGSRIAPKGFTHAHHFYFTRALQIISLLWNNAKNYKDENLRGILKFWLDSHLVNLSVQNRYRPEVSFPYNPLSGVYYIPSLVSEASPFVAYENKLKMIASAFSNLPSKRSVDSVISTGTASKLHIESNSIDYVFTDPPFGENIFYADMNFLVESWHGVITDARAEAIMDKFKDKALPEYQHLMQRCFAEYYRVLKPGRWMTVVFSNSKASVWNAIQVSLQQAGFVVAEVTALDKVQGSYRQVTSTTAVKQDLVISAYKPNGGLEQRLAERGAAPESAWDFVQTHLRQLSVSKMKNGVLEFVVERDPRRIYDRMVAWFVRHDVPVPLSTEEFLDGLRSRFPERDGMVFLPEQVTEYDRKRAQAQAPQIEMFVADERSAIDWLTDFLRKRPSTYQEVHPEFMTQLGAGWKKHETRPELSALLEDNFLRYDASIDVPSQIHNYLSKNFHDLRNLEKSDPRLKAKAKDRWFVPDPTKAQDLEKKREKALLKEFDSYRTVPGRRLREFRLEVLRAGFKSSWAARDFETIIAIAQKVPEEALQEDEKLLFWYDSALTRMEANA